jgi:hypothetical protein
MCEPSHKTLRTLAATHLEVAHPWLRTRPALFPGLAYDARDPTVPTSDARPIGTPRGQPE